MFDDEESTMTWAKLMLLMMAGLVMWAVIIERCIAWYRLLGAR